MPLATNLHRRGAVYYFRARVPLDLVEAFGRAEIWRSLRTKEPKEARRLLPAAQAEFHADCDAKRQTVVLPAANVVAMQRTLTDADMRRFAQEFYAWELEQDAEDRRSGAVTRRMLRDIGAVELNETLVREGLGMGGEAGRIQIKHYADVICEREGIPKQGAAYDRLCEALLRALLEATKRAQERDAGNFTGQPADELLMAPVQPRGQASGAEEPEGDSLASLCADYIAQRRDVSVEWQRAIGAALTEFLEFFGRERPLAAVMRRDVARYKSALLKISAHAVRRAEKLTFSQLVERGREEDEKALANGSINRRLSVLSTFGGWAVREGHVEQNVFAGLALEKKQEVKRRPFSVEQLRTVFGSPLFVGCASQARGDEAKKGRVQLDDWRYWGMPLALYTGSRLGEILQLRVEDVQEVQGVSCIRINDWAEEGGENSEKRVKSGASERLVPLHDAIIRLGFLERVARLRAKGQMRVFPGLKPDNLGREATEPSKFFNRYLTRIGVKRGPALVFHSYRHTLIDGLRNAGHTDPTIAGVVGHTKSDGLLMTNAYGEKLPAPALTLEQKAKIIASVDFGGRLDLSHLRPTLRASSEAARKCAGGP